MSEIEITLPTVQYGNVKVRATPEELGMNLADAGAIGHGVAIYLNLFTQGFNTGFVADVEWSPQEAASAPVSAPQEAPGPEARTAVDTMAEALALLNKGLGGVTVIDGQDPEGPSEEPGESWTETDHAPWDQKVDAKPKPWETDVTAPVVLDAAW